MDKPEGWNIERNPKPILTREFDWDFWHDDVDVDRSDLCGAGSSYEDCVRQIREREDDLGTPRQSQ